MKKNFLVTLALLIGITIQLTAQTANSNQLISIQVKAQEGNNLIQFPNTNFQFNVQIQRGEIISVQRIENGQNHQLRANTAGSVSNLKACQCGHDCWEDTSIQKFICICKGCAGDRPDHENLAIVMTDGKSHN